MSDAKFTKAPWRFTAGLSVLVVNSPQGRIAIVGREEYWEHFSEESLANTHLIAAAPEMYELLQEMLNHSCRDSVVCCLSEDFEDRIWKLLKKARGEK